MSQDKFVSLQNQVRQNQEDVSDFMRDLKNWETNIKQKDDQLRRQTDSDTSDCEGDQPPVRSRVREKKMRKKVKQLNIEVVEPTLTDTQEKNEKKGRIKAYDYRAWDQFDVDKACEDVDGEGYSAGSEYETDSDEERVEMERQRKIQEANAEKDKGNALFKEGCYEDAIACYVRGIDADPTNAILPANKAMALLKLKRYSEAEKDCSLSIHLDFTYVKAYGRRGIARIELGKLEEAKRDFEQVLDIEPTNKQTISQIKTIEKKIKQNEENQKQKAENERLKLASEEGMVRPIHKPPHMRSKKPLRRIVIEEIGQGAGQDEESKEKTEPPPLEVAATPERVDKEEEIILKSKDRRKLQEEYNDDVAASSNVTIPPIPHTSFQLERDWKQLQKYPSYLYQYFKQICPSSYCKILQQSLDATLLNGILQLLLDFYIPSGEPIMETLQCLCNVKRFDMNVMFMSQHEKKVVEEIFNHIRRIGQLDEADILILAKKYGL